MPDRGRLLVCATPIGNLADVTERVLAALRDADVVLAEDTRITRRLLDRYAIAASLERYDEHVAHSRTPAFVARLEAGETFALVSDAGTPGVSDPGALLVDAALAAGICVDVLPGPSAIITALVASGLPTHAFYFGGFVPRKAGDRARMFAALAHLDATLIFYESPHRTAASLAALAQAFPGRQGAMARELTKLHEEVVRGPLATLADQIGLRESLKGEVVLLVGPPVAAQAALDEDAIAAAVAAHMQAGASRARAVKLAAAELGVARNAVYEIALRQG